MNLDWFFREKQVLVGVTGGIAAYKAAELVRLFVRAGTQVHCVLTEAATKFVGPATFEALSGHPVAVEVFPEGGTQAIDHVSLAREADLLVVAPITANTLAKLAWGLADNMLTTLALAYDGPVLLAPGMNVNMWTHPATRKNVALLRERGVSFVGPEAGELACRAVGEGRMAEPAKILEAAWHVLSEKDLAGWRVLVTAGPTREAVDGVRFLTNRSSGKMGYALAADAAARGAEVVLVSGPSGLREPYGVEVVRVETAQEMAEAVWGRSAEMDVVVKAAAVADWRPAEAHAGKLAKEELGGRMTLEFVRTADVLAGLAERRGGADRPLVVGFAAEMGPEDRGREKLFRKGADLAVVNQVGREDRGFGADRNEVAVFSRDGGVWRFGLADKLELAHRIWGVVREVRSGAAGSESRKGV